MLALAAMPLSLLAQGNEPPGVISFQTALGSFKLLPRNDKDPVRGRLEFSFTGTVLISGLQGRVIPSGNLRKEFDDPKMQRQVFFGTGKLVIEGTVRSVQWFGREMRGNFNGRGIFRFYGEFWRNPATRQLETGNYWYGLPTDARAERRPWGTYGMQAAVPEVKFGPPQDVTPRPRTRPGA